MSEQHGAIETVFWDIGGVMLTNGWDHGQRTRVLGRLGVDLAAYERRHERENWYWERGLISARTFFERTVLEPQPELGLSFEALWPMVCGESRMLHAGCVEKAATLRAQGVRVASLNNESRELNEYRLERFGLRRCFDFLICSGYVGEMKPAPEIYRTAIEVSGRPAATALFIDDKAENCEAARGHGMHAIQFDSLEQLTGELEQYGFAEVAVDADAEEDARQMAGVHG